MKTRRLFEACAVTIIIVLCALCARPQETVFLQSGEQYQGTVEKTVDGKLRQSVAGQERDFDIGEVQRIEFQRKREFDGIETAEALSAASALFKDALAVSTDALKQKYPQAGFVVLRDDTVVKVAADGSYEFDRTQVWRVLEQRGADSAFQAIYFQPDRQRAEIAFGITVGPDGKASRVSDSALKTEAVHPQLPEYNYQQRLRFSMTNPVPGATLFLKTQLSGSATALRPLAADAAFWGTEPIVSGSVTLVAEDETLKKVAVAASGIEAAKEGLVWRVSDTPQIMPEPLMPPVAAFAPRVVIAYPKASWADLAKEFTAAVNAAPLASAEGTTVQSLYDRVRRDIRTIDVPQDALPRPPAAPAEVLKRGFGNTVEKALLLEALLDGIGREAHTVLVRGRSSGPLVAEVPRLRGFDGAVVRLTNPDGSDIWLQADDRLSAFGELDADLQGAQGLDLATGEIVTVPARPAEDEGTKRVAEIELGTDGSAVVTDSYNLRGGDARGYRGLADLTQDEAQTWASTFVGSDITGVELAKWSHSDFEKANAEEALSFTYRVPGLAQAAGDFLVLRLPNARYAPTEVGRSTRQYDLFWRGRDGSDVTFTVRAPEGYSVYALGGGVAKEGNGWSLNAGYEKADDGRSVIFQEKWQRDALEAPKGDYQPYREALIRRGIIRNDMIVFEKKKE
jgi:hypothetical protein